MKSYMDKLQAAAAAEENRLEQSKLYRRSGDSRVLCDIPRTEQIEALMRSLPPVQRNRPWSMQELVARLDGRFNSRPHPMYVGQALRALGWTQRRDWTAHGGGRRYWYCG